MGKRLRALLVVALVALTTGATPAQAGSEPVKNDQCDDLSVLAGLAPQDVPEMARGEGGQLREPVLNHVTYEDLPASAVGKGKQLKNVTVPVRFHVVHDNGIGNVSDDDITQQIRVMNLSFSGFYGGVDTGFRFTLVGVTRTNNAEWFHATAGTSAERAMKRALHSGDAGTLEYYSTTAGPFLGWAYFPGLGAGHAYLDGIVVDWESMYKTSETYKDRYDLGFTAVHEAGHWFGLHHTFNGACNAKGDHVDDTPAQGIPTSGCPADGTNDTCPREPGFDPIHNYMDYSYDQCYEELTAGQTARARDFWQEFRA
ncbi:MAG TPA: zinc metalloprotease [Candidatus Limnocylindrales bacterium]